MSKDNTYSSEEYSPSEDSNYEENSVSSETNDFNLDLRYTKNEEELCSECGNKAIYWCNDCQGYFCKGHCDTIHSLKIFRHHNIRELEILKDPELICQKHENETLDFFCIDCSELICLKCLNGEHESHYSEEASDVYFSFQEKLPQEIFRYVDLYEEQQDRVEQLRERKLNLEKEEKALIQKMDREIKRIMMTIVRRRDKLQKLIEQDRKLIEEALDGVIEQTDQDLNTIKSIIGNLKQQDRINSLKKKPKENENENENKNENEKDNNDYESKTLDNATFSEKNKFIRTVLKSRETASQIRLKNKNEKTDWVIEINPLKEFYLVKKIVSKIGDKNSVLSKSRSKKKNVKKN
ncbi:hypothetical protein M0813_11333 [Anaeramoeba flamelloides]|uniref:B box-type domain-containing protein n=1 Tax=Anaeramoeba flamelloides TaxID=1746091 RepID=A0ABQ8ZEW9_9EUKA|nr:hypothetical protein M0813_11333 [Anaeramoeba flamelloides]